MCFYLISGKKIELKFVDECIRITGTKESRIQIDILVKNVSDENIKTLFFIYPKKKIIKGRPIIVKCITNSWTEEESKENQLFLDEIKGRSFKIIEKNSNCKSLEVSDGKEVYEGDLVIGNTFEHDTKDFKLVSDILEEFHVASNILVYRLILKKEIRPEQKIWLRFFVKNPGGVITSNSIDDNKIFFILESPITLCKEFKKIVEICYGGLSQESKQNPEEFKKIKKSKKKVGIKESHTEQDLILVAFEKTFLNLASLIDNTVIKKWYTRILIPPRAKVTITPSNLIENFNFIPWKKYQSINTENNLKNSLLNILNRLMLWDYGEMYLFKLHEEEKSEEKSNDNEIRRLIVRGHYEPGTTLIVSILFLGLGAAAAIDSFFMNTFYNSYLKVFPKHTAIFIGTLIYLGFFASFYLALRKLTLRKRKE